MLEKLLLPKSHAVAILLDDHSTVKRLFEQFEKTDSTEEKEKIIDEALKELKIHALLEEEIFYPAVRKHVGREVMNEADEEHHVARVLIAELERDGRGDDHREAKFTVLAEGVRHHIKEEEGEMLPAAKRLEMDFEALGRRMLERKRELQEKGIPPDAEHAMVAAVGGKGDSPAMRAAGKPGAEIHDRRGNSMAEKSPLRSGATQEPQTKGKVRNSGATHEEGLRKSGTAQNVKGRKAAASVALNEPREARQ